MTVIVLQAQRLHFVRLLEAIIKSWQLCRTIRNLAAHDYGTDYTEISEHFNALHELIPVLYKCAHRFVLYCIEILEVESIENEFSEEFVRITKSQNK